MSENKKLGQEPAFPELTTEYDGQNRILPYQVPGMSKRFYAACMAMQGIMAGRNVVFDNMFTTRVAKFSYELADELLKQESNG